MSETNINVGRHWVIFNPKADIPARIHKSRQDATDEAVRLAEKQPGDTFIVYSAVAAAVVELPKPHVQTFD